MESTKHQLTLEDRLLMIIKRILIVNISNARNIFIRIPLKIMIILIALALKLFFGCIYRTGEQPFMTKPVSRPIKPKEKPTQQSSPSSISAVLNLSENSVSVNRYTSSKSSLGHRLSTYSVAVKSASKTSLINFFTPDYKMDLPVDDLASSQEFSDINSPQSVDLNETEFDCDSFESSFYYDPKTQFSDKNTIDSNSISNYYSNKDGQKMDSPQQNGNGLPDVINQKNTNAVPTDKARKYLEGMDGVKFNEIQVPDTLKKQLEYFDRDELLQLIAYQKKYLDFKETRIKDLENYIDNLVVKIIETEPTILMNTSNVLTKSKNLI